MGSIIENAFRNSRGVLGGLISDGIKFKKMLGEMVPALNDLMGKDKSKLSGFEPILREVADFPAFGTGKKLGVVLGEAMGKFAAAKFSSIISVALGGFILSKFIGTALQLDKVSKQLASAGGNARFFAKELYNITKFLSTEGNLGIKKNNTSPENLMNAIKNPEYNPLNPIYIFFTRDMTGKYGAISKLGSWNIKNGGSQPMGYHQLACYGITQQQMNCKGAIVDLKNGIINNQIPIKKILFISKGEVIREKNFLSSSKNYLQFLVEGNKILGVQLINEKIFLSNYNQMFILGRYNKEMFEESFNAFPYSRLFKFKF